MNVVVVIVVVVQATFEDHVKHIRYHLTNTDHHQVPNHCYTSDGTSRRSARLQAQCR